MTDSQRTQPRVLGIDPTHRGFGYVVFEGPEFLIDWGVRHIDGPKNSRSIEAVEKLVRLYQPDVLVLEDTSTKGCRRRQRVKELLAELSAFAERNRVRVRKVSRVKVRKTFRRLGATNKRQMAGLIASRFSELAPHLPPERKPWMSEDLRAAMFDAAAFGLVFLFGTKPPTNTRKRTEEPLYPGEE